MAAFQDGPASELFTPLPLRGNVAFDRLADVGASKEMAEAAAFAPAGQCVCWGIPFRIARPIWVRDRPTKLTLPVTRARWLVFAHASDWSPPERNEQGLISPMRGEGRLGELAATYVVLYADGGEARAPVQCRHQIGMFRRRWGEECLQAVEHGKPCPRPAGHEQPTTQWGRSQFRGGFVSDNCRWINWLWAWENPHPDRRIVGLRLEPGNASVLLSAVSAGRAAAYPLRWRTRRKALLTLPRGVKFDPTLDEAGLLKQIRLDLGQVISARPRPIYPGRDWPDTHNNQLPEISPRQVLVEYAASPDARFHLPGGRTIPLPRLEPAGHAGPLQVVAPASQRVRLKVVDASTGRPVAAKLHAHGQAGEYLPPVDRHRIPNPAWFEDYSADFSHRSIHHCTYIPGETTIDLPVGRVFVEVSKGFEVAPVRRVVRVTPATREVVIELDKVLPWREKGWVTADTHVHFLSPTTALLEGAAEGVNVVNLLASQWGELMTNVGDFDGRTTHGARQFGGDGEYLVRVGSENRQHVLGHISLLGYRGPLIAPMTTGGPDESALGDPIGALLTEWARQCRKQGGLVVLPHFPNPRSEHAAALVSGGVDAVEMTSWGHLYGGIDPYSLSDWYRYLNSGLQVPAVGGTDKMSATTAVGTVRTYAHIPRSRPFDYQAWMQAVRAGRTFVTYGPLMEFAVEGQPPGSLIRMSATGGTVDVTWELASVTVPMSRVELAVNGEIVRGQAVDPWRAKGHWSVRMDRSGWLALLVRGHYPGQPEIIAAHSSPVAVRLAGKPVVAAADAATILDQIEGSLAYLDTVGTRAETAAYKRMRMVLTAAGRKLHNALHRAGVYHGHVPGAAGASHRH